MLAGQQSLDLAMVGGARAGQLVCTAASGVLGAPFGQPGAGGGVRLAGRPSGPPEEAAAGTGGVAHRARELAGSEQAASEAQPARAGLGVAEAGVGEDLVALDEDDPPEGGDEQPLRPPAQRPEPVEDREGEQDDAEETARR